MKSIWHGVRFISYCLLAGQGALWAQAPVKVGEPKPGDVFREYYWTNLLEGGGYFRPSGNYREWAQFISNLSFGNAAGNPGGKEQGKHLPNGQNIVTITDLEKAVKVEARFEIWNGSHRTKRNTIVINGKPPIDLEGPTDVGLAPKGMDGNHWGYMSITHHYVSLPLDHVKVGANNWTLESHESDMGWPLQAIWGAVFRVYYSPDKPHPTGKVTHPVAGGMLNEKDVLTVEATSPNGAIARVDYFGYYRDFVYRSRGDNLAWQFRSWLNILSNHAGTTTTAPFSKEWDLTWIPDQENGMAVRAVITDDKGISIVTDSVPNVRINRPGKSVKLYASHDVPLFQAHQGRAGKHNNVTIPADDFANIGKAVGGKLYVATWAGHYMNGIFVNDKSILAPKALKTTNVLPPKYASMNLIGKMDNYDWWVNEENLPVNVLKAGVNKIDKGPNPGGHGVEILWPGFEAKVRYEGLPVSLHKGIPQTEAAKVKVHLRGFSIKETGPFSISLKDIKGNTVYSRSAIGPFEGTFPVLPHGVYHLETKAGEKRSLNKVLINN